MAIKKTINSPDMDKLVTDLGAGVKTTPDISSEALIKDLYGDIMNDTEYDVTQDPAYSGLKKAAYREADRTMRDVLAQGNARTNGFVNTAAVAAASQARDYRMSQFDDQIAELEDRALSRETARINLRMQLLNAIEGMEAKDRQEYMQELELEEQKQKQAQSELAGIVALGQIPSDEMFKAAGYSDEYINAYKESMKTPDIGSMSDAELQIWLNSQGAKLDVDGSWGPKSENAYVKIVGQPSGRYKASSKKQENDVEEEEELSADDIESQARSFLKGERGSKLSFADKVNYLKDLGYTVAQAQRLIYTL